MRGSFVRGLVVSSSTLGLVAACGAFGADDPESTSSSSGGSSSSSSSSGSSSGGSSTSSSSGGSSSGGDAGADAPVCNLRYTNNFDSTTIPSTMGGVTPTLDAAVHGASGNSLKFDLTAAPGKGGFTQTFSTTALPDRVQLSFWMTASGYAEESGCSLDVVATDGSAHQRLYLYNGGPGSGWSLMMKTGQVGKEATNPLPIPKTPTVATKVVMTMNLATGKSVVTMSQSGGSASTADLAFVMPRSGAAGTIGMDCGIGSQSAGSTGTVWIDDVDLDACGR